MRKISAKWVVCNEESLAPYREQIIQIAKDSYQSVPTSEILARFSRYHNVVLVFDHETLVGYMFMTQHKAKDFYFIGIRFTAFLPDYQGGGVSKVGFPIFAKLLFGYLVRKVFFLDHRNVIFFCRVCNPFAYSAIHFLGDYPGGEVYPDLPRVEGNKLPEKTLKIYEAFRDEVGFSDIDVRTGVIEKGAVNSGIITHKGFPSRMKFWKTKWNDYVGDGDELVMSVPIHLHSPLIWTARLVQMLIKFR